MHAWQRKLFSHEGAFFESCDDFFLSWILPVFVVLGRKSYESILLGRKSLSSIMLCYEGNHSMPLFIHATYTNNALLRNGHLIICTQTQCNRGKGITIICRPGKLTVLLGRKSLCASSIMLCQEGNHSMPLFIDATCTNNALFRNRHQIIRNIY